MMNDMEFQSRSASVSTPALLPTDVKADMPESPDASASKDSRSKDRADSKTDTCASSKITKRRAARACASCRARKVRCDVVEQFPCGNCRWDNVGCVVQESRRRRKNLYSTASNASVGSIPGAEALHMQDGSSSSAPINIASAELRRPSNASTGSFSGMENAAGSFGGVDGHVPHLLYQRSEAAASQTPWNPVPPVFRGSDFLKDSGESNHLSLLPAFINPLPAKIGPDEVSYLRCKGALSLPEPRLQRYLLQAYIEFVHPYMPLLELHDFLNRINARDGQHGQVSLLLYHAVMFAASAFVGIKALNEAGYTDRRAARKAFFQKARLLYDFDCESDRLVLVQALLLMTYWYEAPEDQKDTWHWMGVAISLAHTIALHRNPVSVSANKHKLRKRIWWSCFMRDRLIALGMRRPTRIKDEDFDVPMLEPSDFETEVLPDSNRSIPPECTLMRDTKMQQELAEMCVQKAKLCVLISHMLKAQYSVLIRDRTRPETTTKTTMMLLPRKDLDDGQIKSVQSVDAELAAWAAALPASCQYRALTPADVEGGRSPVAVQRNLLHMVYQTTISALHRPQFLPSSPLQAPAVSRAVQEISRSKVRNAATQITRMAAEMYRFGLESYLPTTGVTVVLPAMIMHLLHMKDPVRKTREEAQKGFSQCMQVMIKLREIYAAADFAAGFLESALKKAAIEMNMAAAASATTAQSAGIDVALFARPATPPPDTISTTFDDFTQSCAAPVESTLATCFPLPDASILEHSPPHSDQDMNMTPSASGSSEVVPVDVEMTDAGGVDWSRVAMPNLDFDQWLQFPAEGVNNTDNYNMSFFDDGGASFDNIFEPMNESGF
ncbi:Cutinase transcription factor 1 beta [Cytospora mali]|uniref:Cutinase transcription factor 1 beta n=1 Tax=Cytospora mali TaxID=578113 RepID=A0A194UYU2_CYTMA|nr:Cutinase transcription factor 1 beta [Valsa mali var. pyri (nom. inval.)]